MSVREEIAEQIHKFGILLASSEPVASLEDKAAYEKSEREVFSHILSLLHEAVEGLKVIDRGFGENSLLKRGAQSYNKAIDDVQSLLTGEEKV